MRLRVKFAKLGIGKFLSQLEVMRALQRAARRSGIPLALTEGFNPHPRMSFGPALAVGAESEAEYVDLELREPQAPGKVLEALARELPPGLKVLAAWEIPPNHPPVAAQVRCAAYQVEVEGLEPSQIKEAIQRLFAQEEVWVSRKGKEGSQKINIRPGLYQLELKGEATLEMLLSLSSEGSVRPEEVVRALDPSLSIKTIRRTALYLSCGPEGPIPLD